MLVHYRQVLDEIRENLSQEVADRFNTNCQLLQDDEETLVFIRVGQVEDEEHGRYDYAICEHPSEGLSIFVYSYTRDSHVKLVDVVQEVVEDFQLT